MFCWAALIPVVLTGCSLMPPVMHQTLVAPYQPGNVYVRQGGWSGKIQRVAVLPIPQSRQDGMQAAGADALDPVFVSELRKRKVFEVVSVSAERLRELTGEGAWSADQNLPADFFERLRRATGCDAVVFVNLTSFQAYPPLQVGWKVRLVDCEQRQTWWAVDEVFNAGSISVAAAAENYARSELNPPNPLLGDQSVLYSPRRFGRYTAEAVADTLP
jgi:hypothetical protein